jgi:lysozyme family protein
MLSFRTATILTFYVTFIWLSSGFTNIRYEFFNDYTFGTSWSWGNEEFREGEEVSMTTFEQIIDKVLEHEGGYVNDPYDKGGETKFGIAKRWYPDLDIKNLTKSDAVNIYYNNYWKPSKADDLPNDLKATYFDMCVNMGQRQAVKILQQAINSRKMNKIEEDGVIGKITIENAGRISKRRLQAYRCLFYGRLVSEEPDQERFYFGWYKRATTT